MRVGYFHQSSRFYQIELDKSKASELGIDNLEIPSMHSLDSEATSEGATNHLERIENERRKGSQLPRELHEILGDEEYQKGWKLVEKAYENNPKVLTDYIRMDIDPIQNMDTQNMKDYTKVNDKGVWQRLSGYLSETKTDSKPQNIMEVYNRAVRKEIGDLETEDFDLENFLNTVMVVYNPHQPTEQLDI